MKAITISDIAKAIDGNAIRCENILQQTIEDISSDTRNIKQDCLFWCFAGERFDGNLFAADAVKAGAKAAVTSREIEGIPCIVVEDTRKAFLQAAKWYRQQFETKIVGVTGSVGKTTTKNMIALALSGTYSVMKTQGNLNNAIGLPKTLFSMEQEHEIAVIEMGMNHFGEISLLTNTALPTVAVITNIGVAHIENLGSQEGILKAKLEILEGMSADAPLFLNGDDPLLQKAKQELNRPVITFGLSEQCDISAKDLQMNEMGAEFVAVWKDGSQKISLPCTGEHNVRDALAAIAVGLYFECSSESMAETLKQFTSDGMRQNISKRKGQLVIMDCYNANPDSMRAALKVLEQQKNHRKVAVLGDMLELGDSSDHWHRAVAEMAAEMHTDLLFCYGPCSASMYEKAKELGIESYHAIEEADLTAMLKKQLCEGDAVLFKGSRGMHLENVISALYDKEEN